MADFCCGLDPDVKALAYCSWHEHSNGLYGADRLLTAKHAFSLNR
jgi:hypothetical protein